MATERARTVYTYDHPFGWHLTELFTIEMSSSITGVAFISFSFSLQFTDELTLNDLALQKPNIKQYIEYVYREHQRAKQQIHFILCM